MLFRGPAQCSYLRLSAGLTLTIDRLAKGQKKRQIGPAEQLERVKRYKASGAKNATIFAQQHPHDLKVRTFRDWCKWEATGELQRKVAQVAPGRDGGAGKRVRKSKWPELEEKLNQYIDLRGACARLNSALALSRAVDPRMII